MEVDVINLVPGAKVYLPVVLSISATGSTARWERPSRRSAQVHSAGTFAKPGDNIPVSMGEDFLELVGDYISEQGGDIISDWTSNSPWDPPFRGQPGAGTPPARICEGEAKWLIYSTTIGRDEQVRVF